MRHSRLAYCGLCLAVVLALLLASTAAARSQTPGTLEEYRHAIELALALSVQANALQGQARSRLLEEAANLLAATSVVQTPSGALVPVNNAELLELLRDPTKTGRAVTRLTALKNALAPPLAQINPADLAVLEEILGRPPFVRAEYWYEPYLRELAAFFEELLNNTAAGVLDLRGIFVLLALVAVVAVLSYFILKLRRNLVPEQALPAPIGEQEVRSPADAIENARRLVNAGDYRSAVRQLYLASLLTLDQRGRIKYDATLTNREYLHLVSNDARMTAALQPIVETFDRTWYGFEAISPEEFARYSRQVEQVREA